jgi:NitT/TauT family transport system substrate-binding protein
MKTRREFGRIVLGSALAGPLAASAGCDVLNGSSGNAPAQGGAAGGVEKNRLTIGLLASQSSASAKLAEKYGYFKNQGLDVTFKVFPAGPQAFPALLNGELDFAVTNYVSLFQAIAEKTIDAKIVADGNTATENSTVVIAKPDSGITSAKDLAGKKVAIHQAGSVAEVMLRATLRDQQVDPGSVRMLPVRFSDAGAAIQSNQIDAAVEIEPYLTAAGRNFGERPAVKIAVGPAANMPLAGYVALRSYVEKNPITVAALQKALVPGQAAAADRTKLLEVLPELTGVDRETASQLNLDSYATALNPAQIQRVITLQQNYGGLKTQLDANSLIVPTPVGS